MGHWAEVQHMIYKGFFDVPNALAVCKTCGIVFDENIAKMKDSGGFTAPRKTQSKMPWE